MFYDTRFTDYTRNATEAAEARHCGYSTLVRGRTRANRLRLIPIRGEANWRCGLHRIELGRGRVARLLRAALHAVPQALAVELGLDGELAAVVGAGELADRAPL